MLHYAIPDLSRFFSIQISSGTNRPIWALEKNWLFSLIISLNDTLHDPFRRSAANSGPYALFAVRIGSFAAIRSNPVDRPPPYCQIGPVRSKRAARLCLPTSVFRRNPNFRTRFVFVCSVTKCSFSLLFSSPNSRANQLLKSTFKMHSRR